MYEEVISSIRSEIGESSIWISVDETTDANGLYIANMVIRKLDPDEPSRPFLIASKPLEKANGDTLAYFVNASLKHLHPSGVDDSKVLFFYTDAASYMHRAATLLKVFYPMMTHVTCLAHALHRVKEEVRNNLTEVSELISSVKKVFLKAPARVNAFKEKLPDVPLPLEPTLTPWGTWVKAMDYFHTDFDGLQAVLHEFSGVGAQSVTRAQEALQSSTLSAEQAYVSENYVFLADSIKRLETCGQGLCNAVAIVSDVRERIGNVPRSPVADTVARKQQQQHFNSMMMNRVFHHDKRKLQYVLEKDSGFKTLELVTVVLAGSGFTTPKGILPSDIPKFKFAPITSVDVERSFSAYKLVLREQRRSFTPTNLEMVLACYCYRNLT